MSGPGRATARGDTRARIVAVAARLLQEQGPEAVTTRGVAEAAGVQAPALYRHFGDKDGLLDAVAEHVAATCVAAKAATVEAAAADGLDPVADLRTGWQRQVEFGLANPALFRLLSDPDRVRRSPAAQAGRRVLEARLHRVARAGRLRVGEGQAVDLLQAAAIGTIQTLLSQPPDQRDPALAEVMLEAVLQQAVTRGARRTGGSRKATAVAFRAIAGQLDGLTDSERLLLLDWLDRAVAAL